VAACEETACAVFPTRCYLVNDSVVVACPRGGPRHLRAAPCGAGGRVHEQEVTVSFVAEDVPGLRLQRGGAGPVACRGFWRWARRLCEGASICAESGRGLRRIGAGPIHRGCGACRIGVLLDVQPLRLRGRPRGMAVEPLADDRIAPRRRIHLQTVSSRRGSVVRDSKETRQGFEIDIHRDRRLEALGWRRAATTVVQTSRSRSLEGVFKLVARFLQASEFILQIVGDKTPKYSLPGELASTATIASIGRTSANIPRG